MSTPAPTSPGEPTPPHRVPAERSPGQRIAWQRIARRIRVPLGFLVAALFLLLARPTPASLAGSLALVLPGLLLRAYASGYVNKNEELATTGPYAYTRNPLYLGSMLIAFGFALSSRSLVLAVLLIALFLSIYLPTILSEEQFLRTRFPGFESYCRAVPRLLPRLTPAPSPAGPRTRGRFSRELYLRHREYNSAIGAVALYAALLGRLLLAHT